MGATMIRTGRRDDRRAALRRGLAGTLAGLTILAAGALPMAGASPAGATTPACQDQWTNPAGGAWATSTNWSAGVPSASEVACVTIATTAPVTASSITVGGLVVGATAGAAGTSSLAVAGTTTVTGSATVLATGAMSASGTYDQTAGTLLVDGTLSQPANLTLKGAGSVVVGTTGVLVASHQLLLDGPGTLTNRGAVVASAGSSLYADPSPGTMTFDNAGGVLLDEDADVQIQAGATFVEGAGAAVGTAQVSTVDAAVRVAGGTLDLAGSGSSSFLLQNGTLEGTIAQGQLVDAVGTNASSGPLVNHGSLVFPTGGTFTIDPASSLDNEGLVVERGGQLGLSGTFDNAADGTVSVDTSQLVLQGAYDLDNLGTVAIGANGDVLATHTSGLASTVENAGGTIANGHAGASGFTADAGVTFTEGAGTTTGNAVQVDGALDLAGTGASSFLVSSGSLAGTIAADQDVTAQGTVTTSASVDNRGTLVLRALNFDLAAGTTLTNDGVLGLAGGESNVDGNLTNAADGTLTVDHGSELVDPTAGTAITNAGELYLLDG
ncbi:MAG TPA: hypothetical protein VKT18_06930, partial [Acidimicrobiales bacterium]|nr:hypothetical protein [Acidimicrobiales bacterium]